MRIAPYPSRLTGRSPPIENVPLAFAVCRSTSFVVMYLSMRYPGYRIVKKWCRVEEKTVSGS